MPYGRVFNSWNFTLDDRPAPPPSSFYRWPHVHLTPGGRRDERARGEHSRLTCAAQVLGTERADKQAPQYGQLRRRPMSTESWRSASKASAP